MSHSKHIKIVLGLLSIALLSPHHSFSQMKTGKSSVHSFSQTSILKMPISELIEQSTAFLVQEEYLEAEPLVNQLLKLNSESSNFNYRKGMILLYGHHDFEAAIPYLKMATNDTDPNADLMSAKENTTTPDAYYHLAYCYHLNEEIYLAERNYYLFLQNSAKNSILVDQAGLNIIQCKVARELMLNPQQYNILALNERINTSKAEYSPIISLNGKELYYTGRDENGDDDILVSYYSDREWSSPVALNFCRSDRNEASIGLSNDLKQLILFSDATGNGDIYTSNFEDEGFTQTKILNDVNVNKKSWETHYFLSADGQTIIFSSDRKNGYGGRDLYIMHKNEMEEWGEAMNMGPEINSQQDEDSPFLALDNKILYFSTNGEKSMGGFDIVQSTFNGSSWNECKNLGYPINSVGDDIYFSLTADGSKAYLSSSRPGGKGEQDIYEVLGFQNLPESNIQFVTGGFVQMNGSAQNGAIDAVIVNKTTNVQTDLVVKQNEFFSLLDPCTPYKITMTDRSSGALLYNAKFETNCENEFEHFEHYFQNESYQLTATVIDRNLTDYISNSTITIRDRKDERVLEHLTSDESGLIKSHLLSSKKYGEAVELEIHVKHPLYEDFSYSIDTILGVEPLLEYVLPLNPISEEELLINEILATNIHFDFDKDELRDDDILILNKIEDLLKLNSDYSIQLNAHTDCRGEDWYNMRLSNKRAIAAIKYIQARIDDPNRITGVGLGENQPINDCDCSEEQNVCSDDQYLENRRISFELIRK